MEKDLLKTRAPKNWLVESILVTLFCCLPFGIAGIVNASKVEGRHYAGDIEGAQRAADEAKRWTKIGFFIGLAVIAAYGIFLAFFAAKLATNPGLLNEMK
jgi:Interferon-induced transmembrane protein